ncbi:hypothetical protein [Aurantiacibacter poecillastricola]|uniref:hypothetical protein n=1 Tax=Aurantiacibacter poecillastricola TaxID=3064385 RepID=UPI00273DFFB3|nr:hypothetical protein [Aurantiacibacter sp. 219JJ12-13]MDP5263233.1 hypothetical protein [Aurantiacibacter sp. 219JJ12-13]
MSVASNPVPSGRHRHRRTFRVEFPMGSDEIPYRVEFEAESRAEALDVTRDLAKRRDAMLWEGHKLLCFVER